MLKNVFSLSNILVALSLGSILLIYFAGNILSDKPEMLGFGITNYGEHWWIYIVFIAEVLPYIILLFKDNKRNPFYWIATVILIILPFFHMGLFNDLVMRVSIVPLFVYMILCINKLFNTKMTKKIIAVLIVLLVIRCCTIMQEFKNVKLEQDVDYIFSVENFANRDLKIQKDYVYNYVSYDLENNLFVKYLAR